MAGPGEKEDCDFERFAVSITLPRWQIEAINRSRFPDAAFNGESLEDKLEWLAGDFALQWIEHEDDLKRARLYELFGLQLNRFTDDDNGIPF